MEMLLLLLPITASAIALYFLFKPPSETNAAGSFDEPEIVAMPILEPENEPAVVTVHAAPARMNQTLGE